LLDIPFGRVSSYKEVAAKIGKANANRAVGSAVGKNPVFFIIPCHRVLAHDGGLGGYFWGLGVKSKLLDWEQTRP
jgi:AraC family transcriptional regulator of adaptative response/methylated-DNA-[protein]-cysteine methyltransferase